MAISDREAVIQRGLLTMAFIACVSLAMEAPSGPQQVHEIVPAASAKRTRAVGCVPPGLPPEDVAYARLICRQINRWVPGYVTADPRPPVRSNENSIVRRYVPRRRRAARKVRPGAAADGTRSERVAFRLEREPLTSLPVHRREAARPRSPRRTPKPKVRTGNETAHPAAMATEPQTAAPAAPSVVTLMPGRTPLTSQITRDRASARPGNLLRLPLILIVCTLLGFSMLLVGLGRLPALVRHPRSASLPWPTRERLSNAFPVRRRRTSTSAVTRVTVPPGNDVVRRVDGRPDPGEPFQGWSCAGPIVVDVASAGGVVGVCGAGVVRAALGALAASGRHTVIVTADCVGELYGDSGRPEHVTVARTLDDAIGLVHAESVERIRAEEDGRLRHDGREVWLCARADAQQTRLRSLFDGVAEHGVHAVLLGYWPYGLSLTVDDDGRVLSAPPMAEQLTGSYLTTLPPETASSETPPAVDVGLGNSPASSLPSALDSAPARAGDGDGCPQLMILGPEEVKVDGVELPRALERRFSWEVATYLACHPGGATADAIIEELWPDEPLASARKRFTDAVYHIRKALRAAVGQPDGKFVSLRMNRYRLDEAELNVDLWEFESAILAARSASDDCERLTFLRRATELYRGEFAHVGDGLWAEPFRHDLRRKAIGALDEAASLLEYDNPGMAITMLEDIRRITPWAEEADRHIMRIYQRLGRLDDARDVYEALKERLRHLGEEPSAETRDLLDAIAVDSRAG